MIYRPVRLITTRATARAIRTRLAFLAPRVLVISMVAILFGIDTLRPVVSLTDRAADKAATRKAVDKADSNKQTSKPQNDPTLPAWTTPWLPPIAEVAARLPLELALQPPRATALPPSPPTASCRSGTPRPSIAPGTTSLTPAADDVATAARTRIFSLLACRQICPVGPPAA